VRPVTEVSVAQHPIESKAARFTTDNGTLVLNVTHLEFPHVDGRVAESRGAALVALDLRSVQDAQAVTRDPVSRGIQRKSLPLDPDTLRGAISTSVRFRTMAGPVQMELARNQRSCNQGQSSGARAPRRQIRGVSAGSCPARRSRTA
jgi:hypothetical protein